jgi:NAD+ synthase (glutamine-hydrolysing)
MKDGLINFAMCVPELSLGDAAENAKRCIEAVKEASKTAAVAVFPELSLIGSSYGDLTGNREIISASEGALAEVLAATEELDITVILGMPVSRLGRLYDTAVVIHRGEILAAVPKGECSDSRQYSDFDTEVTEIDLLGQAVPFGRDIVFSPDAHPDFNFAVVVGDDLTSLTSPVGYLALAGASVIINPTAILETVGAAGRLSETVRTLSRETCSAVITVSAGKGESTTDGVYGGRCALAALGDELCSADAYEGGIAYATVDLDKLSSSRLKSRAFQSRDITDAYTVEYSMAVRDTEIITKPSAHPFIPEGRSDEALSEILKIQAHSLAERIKRSHSKGLVIGLSGGLDSTLAVLVAADAMDILGMERKNILSVTMPCFGTTKRTRSNAEVLAVALGTDFTEIDIKEAVTKHFEDIGHSADEHNVVYENAQARERTQILMDLANARGALVLGTGDLSELALGFATYNGDHMSMYGVNAGVPKTLMRVLVGHYAKRVWRMGNFALAEALTDILNTPISPELLPPSDEEIQQCTENIVGPYELHDFFLYNLLAYGLCPKKILRLAVCAFDGKYDEPTVKGWLKIFIRRFMTQQFKRSCLPDGPRVCDISLSPRGGLEMPSDAALGLWLRSLGE